LSTVIRSPKSNDTSVPLIENRGTPTEWNHLLEFVRFSHTAENVTSVLSVDQRQQLIGSTTMRGDRKYPLSEILLMHLHPQSLPRVNVQVLQRWEGIVTETDTDSFWAELKVPSEPDYPLELVELPTAEIHPDDQPLIRSGACFYWSIGIKTSDRGVITRVSEIRFQRLPVWTRRSIAAAKKEAEKAFGSFWLAETCSAD